METNELPKNINFATNEQLFAQLEWCGYACEGGPLCMNIAYQEIQRRLMAPAPAMAASCDGCKYQECNLRESPCCDCTRVRFDHYEPAAKGGAEL